MVQAVPVDDTLACPRCGFSFNFLNIDGGQTYLCTGCEWKFALGTPVINTPAVPATTVTATNTSGSVVAVTITGGTLSSVNVNGSQVGTVAGTYLVPVGGTIAITYTVAPGWAWALPATSGATSAGGTGLPVASGGTVFTAGQNLLVDTGTAAEVVQVVAGSNGTNVAITALTKGHGSAVHFGNLVTTPFLPSVQAVPAGSPYPTSQPLTF